MVRITPTSCKLAILILLTILISLRPTLSLKSTVTKLQFYLQDVISGPEATALRVAPSQSSNGSVPSPSGFGSVYVIDDPLTASPDPKSMVLGRAQGIYAVSSLIPDEFSLLMTLTYGFVSGPYKGSTISVVGRNQVMHAVREMPIVGGTGKFRLARGYCLARTHSIDSVRAVVGYNVTVIHY